MLDKGMIHILSSQNKDIVVIIIITIIILTSTL